jgi:hypothetical protein
LTVIDVDSHYEIAVASEDHPFRHLRFEMPTAVEYVAQAVSGDLLRHTPAADAPATGILGTMLNPANTSSARFATFDGDDDPVFESMTSDQRVSWMDSVGIDFVFVNPGSTRSSRCSSRLCVQNCVQRVPW